MTDETEVDAGDSAGMPVPHIIVNGSNYGGAVPLVGQELFLVGRDEGQDIRILDPKASGNHARLYVGPDGVEVEDVSRNGTKLGSRKIPRETRVRVRQGAVIRIGATLLQLETRPEGATKHSVVSHEHLYARLSDECKRANHTGGLIRIHTKSREDRVALQAVLKKCLRLGDALADYAPCEYEVLLPDTQKKTCQALVGQIQQMLSEAVPSSRVGLASFPDDGRSPGAILARACALVRDGDLGIGDLVCCDGAMRELYEKARRAATTSSAVLILGESGTGKERVARFIHEHSERKGASFVPRNCAAIPEALIESELFGHIRGAFTGAVADRPGIFEAATGGTVFLDEIGEASMAVQVKLLRVLQEKKVSRVGEIRERSVDARVLAATNRDLERAMGEGRFRSDLYYRLAIHELEVKPLRERKTEIEPLVFAFLEKFGKLTKKGIPAISQDSWMALKSHNWPGNVRELENTIERALSLCESSVIEPIHLRLRTRPVEEGGRPPVHVDPDFADAPPDLMTVDRDSLEKFMAQHAHRMDLTAKALKVHVKTLRKLMRKLGIPLPRLLQGGNR